MRNFLLLLTIIFFHFSCKHVEKEVSNETVQGKEIIEAKEQSDVSELDDNAEFFEKSRNIESYFIQQESLPDFNILNIIDKKCYVIITPDSTQIKKMKEEYGEDFYTIADDNNYYLYQTREFLDSMPVEKIDLFGTRYIQFEKSNGDTVYLDMKCKFSLPWNLVFFDPDKGVKIADMTVVSEEYNEFFN